MTNYIERRGLWRQILDYIEKGEVFRWQILKGEVPLVTKYIAKGEVLNGDMLYWKRKESLRTNCIEDGESFGDKFYWNREGERLLGGKLYWKRRVFRSWWQIISKREGLLGTNLHIKHVINLTQCVLIFYPTGSDVRNRNISSHKNRADRLCSHTILSGKINKVSGLFQSSLHLVSSDH